MEKPDNYYAMLDMIRVEMDKRDAKIAERLDEIRHRQDLCREKLENWENGASLFKWLVIATAGIIAALASAWDWWKAHFHG